MTENNPDRAEKSGEILGLDNRQLLARHVDGDPTAFAKLINLFKTPVYSYLTRCGVEQNTRDDLFQEIFLKIHSAASYYQPDRPLKPWIYTIVANTVRSFYRKQRIQRIVYKEDPPDQPVEGPGAEEYIEAKETAQWLESSILKLPFQQREALLMCSISKMDQKSAASALGTPLNTFKTNLRRARLTLAKKFASHKTQEGRKVSK